VEELRERITAKLASTSAKSATRAPRSQRSSSQGATADDELKRRRQRRQHLTVLELRPHHHRPLFEQAGLQDEASEHRPRKWRLSIGLALRLRVAARVLARRGGRVIARRGGPSTRCRQRDRHHHHCRPNHHASSLHRSTRRRRSAAGISRPSIVARDLDLLRPLQPHQHVALLRPEVVEV
jgi:hypothetical protein